MRRVVDPFERYQSPLVARNASEAMARLFGDRHRITIWRRLWIALADAERKAGLKITARQIADLKQGAERIDFAAAARYEKDLRHDVMAHLHAFADQAPSARPILHLGATSADIVDNADLIIMRDALVLIRDWLVNVIDALAVFARTHRALPTLGYTHFQPAQLTTVGKRAVLWCYDFVRDFEEVQWRLDHLKFRGVKGTTGTQASFLELFDGNERAVDAVEKSVARAFGFDACEPVTGQTYSRKVDAQVVNTLAGTAASVHKFANDVRLLAHLKEIEEPFETAQVGSSAMAYKRNPMRCERATGLARFVISLANSPLQTAAEQWFERTLDDSANKRLTIPESFLATDGMLRIVTNVVRGLVVHPAVIGTHLDAELPFMATENILMAAVKAGGDRQELHERIRRHSQSAARRVKDEGLPNDLLGRLADDPAFREVDIAATLDARQYVGRAPQQVDAFIRDMVNPIRRKHRAALGMSADLDV
ncbi:MAG: adenylosuccinate lyase [Phycisphaerales bacterium]|nr:adenylosuccinate lyase [Phycisphaerales bacterium]